jgi:outer membrane protein
MLRALYVCALICCTYASSKAQEVWTLEQCIEYALQNNIQLKLGELNIANNKITEDQGKYNVYPNVNGNFSNGFSLGRSINPTTNEFVQQGYYYNGPGIGADVLLFGWFSRKYQREQNTFNTLASQQQYKQLQNDISLNIATAYLRILLTKEQVKNAKAQLDLDEEQRNLIAKRVKAGSLPELNLAQLNAQVAQDSSAYTNAKLDVQTAILDLKSILNLDLDKKLDIAAPTAINDVLSNLNYPDALDIYNVAVTKQFNIEQAHYNIKSAQTQLKLAKSALYPTVSAGWQIGTNYASTVREVTSFTENGTELIGNIKFNDSLIPITRPAYDVTTRLTPFFKQYGNNIRQTFSVNINIPIFNGFQSKYNITRAQLGVQQQEVQLSQTLLQLKQNIYKAHNDYLNGIQRYNASLQQVKSADIALSYATKRLDAGMLSTQEYITQQNALQRAQIAALQAKYEAVFKAKILDFYLNKPIKL